MEIKSFILNFFKSLNCEIKEGDVLIINNVPEEFEKLYGKKAPYNFVFNESENKGDVEFINNNSKIFGCVNEYLKNKGKTILLKLKEKEIKEDLPKYLLLNNYEIVKINKINEYDYVFRFTFESQFNYLNQSEKAINKIYIHENGAIDNFIIEDYETVLGDKKDIQIKNIKNEVPVAKQKLKELIQEKIKNLGEKLKKSLNEEIKRIEDHYNELFKEIEKEIEKNELRILDLKEKKPENYSEKIKRSEKIISNLIEKSDFEKLKSEKEFQIKNEKNKHSLEVFNKLLNKIVLYYPIYNMEVYFKRKNNLGRSRFKFNSLTKQILGLECVSCKNKIKKINFCVSGHLTCENCLEICGFCMSEKCPSCNNESCCVCGRDVCKNCKVICNSCGKAVCNQDIRNDFLNEGYICSNCSEICSNCRKFTKKDFFREKDNQKLCPKCFNKNINPLERFN